MLSGIRRGIKAFKIIWMNANNNITMKVEESKSYHNFFFKTIINSCSDHVLHACSH